MKVLLVGNYAPDRQFSMLGFAECLRRELPRHGVEVGIVAPRPVLGRIKVPQKVKKWLAYGDKYLLFPRELRRSAWGADVVHILDHGNAMYVAHVASRPHLVTCHDLLAVRASLGEFPYWTVGPTGRKYQSLILEGLKRSRAIVAVSEATREDVERLAPPRRGTVRTIYNGIYEPLPNPSDVDRRRVLSDLGVQGEFLLHVGSDSPYKNRGGAVKIWEQLHKLDPVRFPTLVLAGKGKGEELWKYLPQSGVQVVDSPTRLQLAVLYRSATGLIFPSLNEGFGLPILEAQSLGCPVFTSNRAPMTEVGGDAAVYFDPDDPDTAAEAVMEGLKQRELLVQRGYSNCQVFTASIMAQEYVEAYRQIIGSLIIS